MIWTLFPVMFLKFCIQAAAGASGVRRACLWNILHLGSFRVLAHFAHPIACAPYTRAPAQHPLSQIKVTDRLPTRPTNSFAASGLEYLLNFHFNPAASTAHEDLFKNRCTLSKSRRNNLHLMRLAHQIRLLARLCQ